MMADTDPRKERRKQRARVGICLTAVAMTVLLLVQPDWEWVPLTGVIAITVIATIAASGDLPGGHGRGSGLSGRGRDDHGRGSGLSGSGGDDDDGPVGAAAYRWHMLIGVSRLMPRSAGRRWLAEAESLLSEITATRRGAAIRSYLLSAPRLVVMTWAREIQRRARLGPRRPG
jgi:hypothetical protein